MIISPWNYPFVLCLDPLVSALAAGNCVVIKPSEVSSNSEACIQRLVTKYLDSSCVKVVQGGVPETTELLKLCWDHIMFTGSSAIGKVVATAAAEHLTPVTLELGGKCPVIVDSSAKIEHAATRVCFYKFLLNCGQTCIAPDYCIVHRGVAEQFVKRCKQLIEEWLGTEPIDSPNFGRIISQRHAARLLTLLTNVVKSSLVIGGSGSVKDKYVAPTIVTGCSKEDPLMHEEIFGPILPIVVVNNMEEALQLVECVCPQPLAAYVFAERQKVVDRVVTGIRSGGVCVNTVMQQFVGTIPFGGVGTSGYGAYHGKAGFNEFSVRRSVVTCPTSGLYGSPMALPMLPVPWLNADRLFRVGAFLSYTVGVPFQKLQSYIGSIGRTALVLLVLFGLPKLLVLLFR